MKAWLCLLLLSLTSIASAQDILYKVLYAKGDAFFSREDNRRQIVKGDLLMGKDIIHTEADALVILAFGDDYKSKMKVTQNSEITLEPVGELKENGKTFEKQSMYIKLGNIVVDYANKHKDKKRLEIKTQNASMGIRGTRFFVHVTPDDDTVVAVHHGVVAVKHLKKNQTVVLNNKQGVVMSEDVARDRMDNPKWFGQINWDFDVFGEDFKKLYHGKGFTGDIERDLYRSSSMRGLKDLKEDQKKLSKECDAKKAESCGKLAMQLLSLKEEGDTTQVRQLFKRGCELKDQGSCIWIGRTEYEFGDKDKGKKYLKNLCTSHKMSYACYMMWEISEKEADSNESEYYLKKSMEAFHDLKDFDSTLADFSTKCETGDAIACTNIGILMDNIKKGDKATSFYEKACGLGDGDACSNLGYGLQEKGKLTEAQKYYQKACYLNASTGCYNLACVYSTKDNLDLAVQYLKMAIVNGYVDWNQIESDKDLANLRAGEQFKNIVKEYKK